MAKKERRTQEEAKLQLTSMMDIFTNVLIFLLMNVSNVQLEIKASEDLTLPASVAVQEPELNFNIVMSRKAIFFENTAIELEGGKVPERYHDEKVHPLVIQPLYKELQKKVEESKELAGGSGGGYKFEGRVLLQVHKEMEWETLKEVLVTSGAAGFGEFKFVVNMK
jgi:biopolymer transport protein ExbD